MFAVTSADRLYRGLREPRPYVEELVSAEEEGVPVVSVLDGHSHALAFIGAALGVPQTALGVDDFGQSGSRADLYRHYGIDAAAIVRAAHVLLGMRYNSLYPMATLTDSGKGRASTRARGDRRAAARCFPTRTS